MSLWVEEWIRLGVIPFIIVLFTFFSGRLFRYRPSSAKGGRNSCKLEVFRILQGTSTSKFFMRDLLASLNHNLKPSVRCNARLS